MNEKIIMGMVAPYLKGNTLTNQEFEQIFSMLSLKEQYGVLEILDKNQIELIENHTDADDEDSPDQSPDNEEDAFELLYADNIFSDDEGEGDDQKKGSEHEEHKTEYLKVRRKILLSNRVLIGMIQEGDAQTKQDLCIKNHGLVNKWAGIYQKVYGNYRVQRN